MQDGVHTWNTLPSALRQDLITRLEKRTAWSEECITSIAEDLVKAVSVLKGGNTASWKALSAVRAAAVHDILMGLFTFYQNFSIDEKELEMSHAAVAAAWSLIFFQWPATIRTLEGHAHFTQELRDLHREDCWEYPRPAVREALAQWLSTRASAQPINKADVSRAFRHASKHVMSEEQGPWSGMCTNVAVHQVVRELFQVASDTYDGDSFFCSDRTADEWQQAARAAMMHLIYAEHPHA